MNRRVFLAPETAIERFDADSPSDGPSHRAALASLTTSRALRWDERVDLTIMDFRG